jgi:hypothetical protein
MDPNGKKCGLCLLQNLKGEYGQGRVCNMVFEVDDLLVCGVFRSQADN